MSSTFRPSILAVSIAALVLASGAKASTISWDGESADNLWATKGNWFDTTGSSNDVLPLGTDDLVFGLGGAGTINLGGVRTANSITFSLNGFTLGTASTLDVLTNTSGAITVNTGITGQINAILAGTNGLSVSGGGSLILAGTNTFVGPVSVTGGSTLSVSSDTNLGAVANGLSLNGGNLNATAAITSARQLTLGSGTNVLTFATGASVWTGQITGSGDFTKNGTGTLELGGSVGNTTTGQVIVNNGTLFLNKTAGNAIGSGGLQISSDSTPGFGSATVTLKASEQIDDNAPVVIDAKNSQTGGATNRAALDLAGKTETIGSLTMNTTTTGSAVVVLGANGKLVLNGDLNFNNNRNAAANSGRELLITGSGNYTTTGVGGTLDLGGAARTITVNSNFTGANLAGADATIEAVITNGSLVKAGTQALRLGAANTYTGSTTVTGGTLRALVAGAIPANSDIFLQSATAGTTATLDLNNTSLTPKSLTFGGGAGANTLSTGTGTLTLAGNIGYDATNNPQTSTLSGKLDLGGAARTFDIADSTGTTTELVISAVISGANTGITKTGSGTLVLSGANTYTGSVTINGGALAPRAANAIGGDVTVNSGGVLAMDTGGADNTAFNNFLGAASNGVTLNGGIFQATSNTDRTLTGRVFTIGGVNSTIDTLGNYSNFTESGALTQVRLAAGTQSTIFTGTAGITKSGGGRLTLNSASPNFSGAWTINNGTVESAGNAMGNAAATNTITINGGHWAITGDSSQPLITLNGGAIGATGGNRTVSGQIDVTNQSYVFLNDFWRDFDSANRAGSNLTRTITHTGVLTGSDPLGVAVNRAAYEWNGGTFVLKNTSNSYSGKITVGKNLNLESNPTGGSGTTLGTASVELQGGHLRLRDNGTSSGGVLTYGNNISVAAPSGIFDQGTLAGTAAIDVDRVSGTNTGNTFKLGALSIGAQQLDVTGANGYGVSFNGMTTLSGNATLNVNNTTVTLAGGTTGTGQTLTKIGNGTLRVLTTPAFGIAHTAGTIELPDEPAAGRSVSLPAGKGFGAGYAATQVTLIDHIALNSAGVVALGKDSTFNPDFTGFTGGVRLGASSTATLTGTITPADSTYRLGGGAGTLTLATQNALTGARSLDVNTSGTAAGTVILGNSNNYTGTTTVGGGMILGIVGPNSISSAALTLDDGTLKLVGNADYSSFATRTIALGTVAGTGTLDTGSNNLSIVGVTGAAANVFTKDGAGKLTLTGTSAFLGKTTVLGGTLAISADANLGVAPTSTNAVADQLVLSGGTLQFTGATTINSKRGITLGTGGGVIDTQANAVTIASPIVGPNPFTKEGSGTLTITADPNNTGGFTINGGVLALQHGGSTDGHFVVNNSATLRVVTANDLGDAYNVTLNSTGATLDLRASDQISQLLGSGTVLNDGTAGTTLTVSSGTNSTFAGQMKNGASALGFTKSGSNTVTLTNNNTYTGTTSINSAALVVSGPDGALSGSATVNVGDNNGGGESLTMGAVSDVVSGTLNRLADNANLTLNGSSTGGFTYNGPAVGSGGKVETIGTLTASAGRNTFTMNPGTGNDVQITTGTFVRNSGGTILVRGANLGGTGTGSTRLFVTNASSALVGAGGADGSTTKSIIPFALGDTSATGVGSGFLTHDANNGVRLLTASEYDTTIAGTAVLRNVSTAGGEAVSSDVTVNSLRLTGTAATTIGAGTSLTVNSGAVLFTDGSSINGDGTLDFGAAEGVIQLAKTTAASAAINTRISGSNGLSVGHSSDASTGVITLGGDNTVVGNLYVNRGTLNLGSSNALNANSPMTVLLRPSSTLGINGNSVVVRDLQGLSTTAVQNGSATAAATLTTYLTGARTFSGIIQNGGTSALNFVVSGNNTLTIDADASATGSFEQRAGTTVLSGSNGTLNDFTSYAINGGTLRLTNASGSSNGNRLKDGVAINMNGGTLDFDNNASGAAFSETTGGVVLNSGANTITVDKGASTTNTSVLTIASLTRSAGATLNLTSQNNGTAIFDLGTAANSRLVFSTAPTLDDGIIGGWATIDSSANTREFVKYAGSGNTASATALAAADYTTTLASTSTATQNVKLTASPAALTGNTQINSLNLQQASASTVDIGAGNTLRVESGGIIVSGGYNAAFTNGTLTAGNGANAGGDLVFHTVPLSTSGLAWTNSSDTITLANMVDGTPVVFNGTAPGGLAAGTTYYVVSSTATSFKVATTPGGTAINITNDGTAANITQFNYTTTVNSVIADNGANPVNLVKTGGAPLVLTGVNTYTGKTFINGGTLRIDNDSNLGGGISSFAADKITLSNNGTLEVTSDMTLDANRGITVGAGTNVISIPAGTANNGKTLTYNGAITSLGTTEGSLQFKSNTTPTNIDGGKINATFSSAVNLNGSLIVDAGSVTLTGATNTFGRSLNIGTDGNATLAYTGANNRLVVGAGITDTLTVGGGGAGDTVNNQGTLNLSGLGNLTANVDLFQIGVGTASRTGKGAVTLATNNDIVAGTAVYVGFSNGSGNNSVTSSLTFGSGVNNVMTKTFIVGGNKSVGNATVAAGGTVNLNGFGENTLDLLVGAYTNTGTVTTAQSTFDMTGGTLNANLNRLAVGEKTGGSSGGVFGTLTLGAGNHNIVANSMTIGNVNGNNAAGSAETNGTVNIGGGDVIVNSDVSIGLLANNTVGTPKSTGTLNITGGKLTVGGNITTTTNNTSATSTVNLDGGTLDLTGGSITVDNFNVKGGTLQNVAQIQGGDGAPAALTKTTAATLTLAGMNTYSGDTNVNAGAVVVNGSIAGAVNVASAATLGGHGSIGGAVAIAAGATLAPDTLSTGNLTFSGGTFEIGITSASSYNGVSVTGGVALNAPVTLSLSVASTFAEGTQFTLISNDGSEAVSLQNGGLFVYNNVSLGQGAVFHVAGDFGTQAFQMSYAGGVGGNDVVITAVPEPSSAAALLAGLGALTGMRRFRRRQNA